MKLSLETRRLALFAALLLWCTLLIAFRAHWNGQLYFAFLWWNLFLSCLPLLFSAAFKTTDLRQRPFMALLWFSSWLLFFPNAPYILTDLVHLTTRPPVPLWYDMMILLSCAGTGLVLGYHSLHEIHSTVEKFYGRTVGWSVVIASSVGSGYAIYLGRFLRWNSWDALTNPLGMLDTVASTLLRPWSTPLAWQVTLIFGTSLMLGYLALRVLGASPSWVDISTDSSIKVL